MMGEGGPRPEDVMSNEEAMRMAFEMVKNKDRHGMMLVANSVHNFFQSSDYLGAMRLLNEGVAEGVLTSEKRSELLASQVREVVSKAEIAAIREYEPVDPAASLERQFADAPELVHVALDALLNNTERKIAEQEQRLQALRKRKQSIEEKISKIPEA